MLASALRQRATPRKGQPLALERSGARLELRPVGDWTAARARTLYEATAALDERAEAPAEEVCIDFGAVTALDATGGWLLRRSAARHASDPGRVRYAHISPERARLLDLLGEHQRERAEPTPRRRLALLPLLDATGASAVSAGRAWLRALGFLGMLLASALRTALRPRLLPATAVVHHMGDAGVRAFPIVSLIGFLIGTVIAYQGVAQLSRFGAEVLVVELVAFSVLREVGILLTALVVAGRSGSAFTAEIGSMMLSDEVDAMRTMGLDPVLRLVAPRVLALVAMLPLLTFAANLAALAGGALGAWMLADLSPLAFALRLDEAVGLSTLAVGLVKAPFFALMIALAGCYQGLQVRGGARALGARTTRSVVQAIFLVIVMDALLSIVFAEVGL